MLYADPSKRALARDHPTGRRLAPMPLRCTGPYQRAEALEELSEEMIVSTPVPGGVIRFYAPAPLLRHRATGMLTKEVDTIRWIDSF